MHQIIQFIEAHPVELMAVGTFLWWAFSNFMSHSAPLPQNAGWWATSVHDFLQFVAANPYKFSFNQQAINPIQPSLNTVETVTKTKTLESASLSITPK